MEVLNRLKKQIIVSCQGYEALGNPFFTKEDMYKMVLSAQRAGSTAVRLNNPDTIRYVKQHLPEMVIIGIWKVETPGYEVFITTTFEEARTLIELGCDIVAIDGTNRVNRLGQKGYEVIQEVKQAYPQQLIMADLSTIEEAREAVRAGADIISTTLSGYTRETSGINEDGPDFELIQVIRKEFPSVFINAEGRIWTIEDATKAFKQGADMVTVGTAITNPMLIAKRFVEKVKP